MGEAAPLYGASATALGLRLFTLGLGEGGEYTSIEVGEPTECTRGTVVAS